MGGALRAKSNWFKHKNPKNRNSKLVLKFDEEDRNDFLTGFQRRKKERREHAQKIALERQKEEKLQARKERRDAKKELLSNTELYFPNDFESEVNQKNKAEVYDHAHHTVTVTTVTKVDLSEHGGLGTNKFEYEDEENVEDREEGSNSEEEQEIKTKKRKKSSFNKSKWYSSDITRQKFWMKLKTRKQELKKLSKSNPQAFSKSKQQQRRLLKKHGRRK